MRKRAIRHPWRRLLPLGGVLLVGVVALSLMRTAHPTHIFGAQVTASLRVQEGYAVLRSHVESIGIGIDRHLDPNHTGIIGVAFSAITTTVGHPQAKRTSTNPDFAAYLVRVIDQYTAPTDGPVVITLSGSFPALGLAAVIACEELERDVVILSSVGASSYGANRPEFTWLDMEQVLLEEGIIRTSTQLASLGAGGDIGEFPWEEGRESALAAISRSGVPALTEARADVQLRSKLALMEEIRPQMLVNIGGNEAHIGRDGYMVPPGLVTSPPAGASNLGMVGWFLERDLPVVHLVRVEELALRLGIAVDPVPLPKAGSSGVYHENGSLLWPAAALLAVASCYLIVIGIARRAEGREDPASQTEVGSPLSRR